MVSRNQGDPPRRCGGAAKLTSSHERSPTLCGLAMIDEGCRCCEEHGEGGADAVYAGVDEIRGGSRGGTSRSITGTPILRSRNFSRSLWAACASPTQKESRPRPGDAIAEMSNLSGSFCPGNGTGEFATREVPTNQRTSLLPENALQFHRAQETCKSPGNITSIAGLHLVSC